MKISYYTGVCVLLGVSMQVFGMEREEVPNSIVSVQEPQQQPNEEYHLRKHRNLGSNNLREFFRVEVEKECCASGENQRSPTYRSLLNGDDYQEDYNPSKLQDLQDDEALQEDSASPIRQITTSPLSPARRLVVGSSSRVVSPQRCSPPAALGRLALQRVLSH